MHPSDFDHQARRQRAVAWAVALTAGTALAPQGYERHLLALYQDGVLTLEEMLELLHRSVYQVLYHSRATIALGEADLGRLLDQARRYNAAHHITGQLLYCDGRYVQALEGPAVEVRRLYARIQADPRHAQVTTVYAGPGPQRHFADWCMGFGRVGAPAVEQVLGMLQAAASVPALAVEEPHLQALLTAFGYAPVPEARFR